MAKELLLLDESALRFKVRDQYAHVYFASDPQTILGSHFVGKVADTDDHHQAWEYIDRVLGHLMPADMVDEEYLDLFDGVAYIGGGFAYVTCPNCGNGIPGDDLQDQVNRHGESVMCPHCGSQLTVIHLNNLSIPNGRRCP